VTDGTTNASLPRGADPGAVTIANALELLEARRNAGPSKKRPRRAPARKKPAATKRPPRGKREA
jgi:DNA topoisomerase-1